VGGRHPRGIAQGREGACMRYFKILALMLGLVWFAWIVRQIGLAELQQALL